MCILLQGTEIKDLFLRTFEHIKGNLAHKFMAINLLCLGFHLDISKRLKTKSIGNTGEPKSHRGYKFNLEIPINLDFLMTPCVTSLLWGIPL